MATATTRRKSITLRERVASPDARVDVKTGVIHNVKVIGLQQSKNKRRYTKDALRRAIPQYEGIGVFMNHEEGIRQHGRDVDDKVGWLSRVHMESDGLYADLHLLKSDRRVPKILEAAVRNPNLFGLSHNAVGQVAQDRGRDDEMVVENLEKIHSVDLVSSPASTGGLFESTGKTGYAAYRDSVRGLSSVRESANPDDDEPKLNADDDGDPDDFATGVRKRSTAAARTFIGGAVGKIIDQADSDNLGLIDTLDLIRKALDDAETAITDGSTTIGDDATESYSDVRAGVRGLSGTALTEHIRKARGLPASGSYASMREIVRGSRR